MAITLNKETALYVTRMLRVPDAFSRHTMRRINLVHPELPPRKRWTKTALKLQLGDFASVLDGRLTVSVAVPDQELRLKTKHAISTIYGGEHTLPPRSFIEVRPGLAISCPELLFVEMASTLMLPEHLMLGYELCGGFSRDAADPLNGPVAFDVKPVTSCAKIAAFLEKVRWVPGVDRARRTLGMLADNAWSPTEAIVATLASLPLAEFGYELGPCTLNKRIYASGLLAAANEKGSRVPDILFGDSKIGINYDGAVHLDLGSVADAAIEVGRNPGEMATEKALDQAVREVRAKVVDDIRRNRELAAAGYTVFPVVKEDLYEEDGLDHVMLQVIEALEKYKGRDMHDQRRMLNIGFGRMRRQELIWSLLPGKHPTRATDRGDGLVYLDEPQLIGEMVIGF